MGIKIKAIGSRALVVVLAFLVIAVILVFLVYWRSLSLSPLNVWQGKSILTRCEEIGEMGLKGVGDDIWGEIKYKFRTTPVFSPKTETGLTAKIDKQGFQVYQGGSWQRIFVKGVNIGTALPGKWFTEFPTDERVYLDWFEKIGKMNANTVRVYTLLPPEFYRALLYYNVKHSDHPLWLLQEIWPEENPAASDYLTPQYVKDYFKELRYAVDAVHGRARIPERRGRAFGNYDSDVSPYVLGYLVGRELEPDEVIATNRRHEGFYYTGEYLASGEKASPAEGWLAMNCDYVLKYEENKYGTQHPVAIVSWPTLDVQEHDAEWNAAGKKFLEYNDKISIDINHILTGPKLKAGFFGAYHIYPNYPDFMNNESKYKDYCDDEGRFMYGGYLKEFMQTQTEYPALVAEFGLATGMGNAHSNPDGYDHGGLTEEEQGRGIVRMMKAIKKEGYVGGVIFEWMDEWAKKTWITEPFMIPYERHVLWHNALDPEQNYGIYAMESVKVGDKEYIQKGDGMIRQISLSHDSTFLYLDIVLNRLPDFGRERLVIGLDTYGRNKGEFRLSPELETRVPTGLEFLVDLSGPNNASILVNPGYNIAQGRYQSVTSSKGIFEEIRPVINKERVTRDGRHIKAILADGSRLYYGDFSDNCHNHWYFEGNTIHVRLPWGRLNVADPSSRRVLDDPRRFSVLTRDELHTVETPGILVYTLLVNRDNEVVDMLYPADPYRWKGWEEPKYRARLKKSYYIIRDFFAELP